MNWGPDREWLAIDEQVVPANCDRYYLTPGGWLAGISATVRTFDGWERNRSDRADLDGIVRVEVTDPDDVGLYGRFVIPIATGYHKGGVLFPELLPNLNSAFPYVLRFLDKPPALRVFQIACWLNSNETMEYREQHTWKAGA